MNPIKTKGRVVVSEEDAWPQLSQRELSEFERLKVRLATLWADVLPRDDAAYTCVVVPSVSVEGSDLSRHPEALFFEETLLFLLIRLRNPRARVIYVTSQQISPEILDYYLQFLAGIPASHARARLTTIAVHDRSLRPLAEKILERPRLVEKIRAAIPDATSAYLTVFRSTPLECRLAVALGIPLNAADPGMDRFLTKSEGRRIFREAGIAVPAGAEDLASESDLVDALVELRRQRPGLRRALLKLNKSHWDEGHALYTFPESGRRDALPRAFSQLAVSAATETPELFLERFERIGGVVEELVEAPQLRTASAQLRINPTGAVALTSSHDELRGGARRTATEGCRFPASQAHRAAIQEAGLRVAGILAAKGLLSRISVECLVVPSSPLAILGSEINMGVGGSTHPLLAVRSLCGGQLDRETGLFHSPAGRPKYYRATDALASDSYRGLSPEDLIEMLAMNELNYSPRTERGTLFYMLGAIAELGRIGMVAVGNSREEAETLYQLTVDILDRESRR